MTKTKLTPLGKLVALVLCVSLLWVAGAVGAAAVRPHARSWDCVLVRSGDSLWSLAKEHSSEDPRKAVDEMIGANGLAGAGIHPGMAIWVPKEDPDAASPVDPSVCEGG